MGEDVFLTSSSHQLIAAFENTSFEDSAKVKLFSFGVGSFQLSAQSKAM